MLIPVILSGGVGARLWPVSRESYPKPFIRLADGQSLLQKTLLRAIALPATETVITVTNQEYRHATRDEYRAACAELDSILLLEPSARNTAPAIAMAALYAMRRWGPDVVLLILPADHVVAPLTEFQAAVETAGQLAAQGRMVVFGISPTSAETAYGYIESGDFISETAAEVKRFVEKPVLAMAEKFLASGTHWWNSGMFCFTAQTFLDNLRRHAPELHAGAERCFAATPASDGDSVSVDAAAFAALPAISIDYAVMEKAANVAVVRAGFSWSDVGSWNAVSELTAPDAAGNRTVGESIMLDSSDCYVQSADRVVAGIGLHGLLIVDTPDALLIADRRQAQQVRAVTERLKLDGHPAHKIHRTVTRPWGTYTLLEQGPGFKLKRIVVNPGAALSLQMHRRRSEHWVVIAGTATVVNGDREFVVELNQSTYIPAGNRHRLSNRGQEPLAIIEVQTGDYVEEDDIVRFDDVYGRS
ncbi:MAG: mannose-phosphate guanylyltransferase/mannose-6-phosphate isomerase [Betaproteobacteria bacterium]|nr:mannose-phosphate guanylyltransferase/mannose-6-phosphate isomerase [Betaproteobacteria bacterium]